MIRSLWRVDGKVKQINRPDSSTRKRIIFDYDAMGNRIAKHVINDSTDLLEHSTYYVLDASGNTLSTYEHEVAAESTAYLLSERHIYGSARLGIVKDSINMFSPPTVTNTHVQGERRYELTNHLGNVLSVITDKITPLDADSDNVTDGYQVFIESAQNYSPFGVVLDDGDTTKGMDYRYGFNGMEKDDEVKGEGNSYTTEFRQYDPRLARWWSLDPLMREFPGQSPYLVLDNNPLNKVDKDGKAATDPPPQDEIRKGNGPSSLAKRNNISLENLAKFNPEVFKNYEKYENKNEYWKNEDKNWLIHPGQKLNITDPTNQTPGLNLNGFGKANLITDFGASLLHLQGATYRLYNQRGTNFSPKIYLSGWKGGSIGRINTFSLGKTLGYGTLGLGVALDIYGVYNYYSKGPNHVNSVSPTKAGINLGMTGYGLLFNPAAAAVYFSVDGLFPGGWPNAMKSYQTTIKDFQESTGEKQLVPLMFK